MLYNDLYWTEVEISIFVRRKIFYHVRSNMQNVMSKISHKLFFFLFLYSTTNNIFNIWKYLNAFVCCYLFCFVCVLFSSSFHTFTECMIVHAKEMSNVHMNRTFSNTNDCIECATKDSVRSPNCLANRFTRLLCVLFFCFSFFFLEIVCKEMLDVKNAQCMR